MFSGFFLRGAASECVFNSESRAGKLPQRQGLGEVHGRGHLLAQQKQERAGVHAVGLIRSKERRSHRQGKLLN